MDSMGNVIRNMHIRKDAITNMGIIRDAVRNMNIMRDAITIMRIMNIIADMSMGAAMRTIFL